MLMVQQPRQSVFITPDCSVTQNHNMNMTGTNSFYFRHNTKTRMRGSMLETVSVLTFFLVSFTLSNRKQPRLPVTKQTSPYCILTCSARTQHSLHKTLKSEKGDVVR